MLNLGETLGQVTPGRPSPMAVSSLCRLLSAPLIYQLSLRGVQVRHRELLWERLWVCWDKPLARDRCFAMVSPGLWESWAYAIPRTPVH